ncbi:MAG: NAD(P)H-hydrate dehydratase [Gemmatimonas sp.]
MQITTAAEASARDADAIAAGIDSWALMHAAGTAAAEFIRMITASVGATEISVWAGSGNNGGDAYVVAAHLMTHTTFRVKLTATGEPKSPDAKRARDLYLEAKKTAPPFPDVIATTEEVHFVFVDGLLGTGQHGALRAPEREITELFNQHRRAGWTVLALDLPTGVNATTGDVAAHALRADYTLAFGTMKRAHLLKRDQCGEVIVFDIGLGEFAEKEDGAWTLADAAMLHSRVPAITWDAHKGTRGKLAIVGGAEGMAGAVVLASQAALRSGAGLVYAHVNQASVLPLQISVSQAIASAFDTDRISAQLDGMHAVVIGPGFGRTRESEKSLNALLKTLITDYPKLPVAIDADALTLIGSDANRLALLAEGREVVCTPHVREFERLIGKPVADTLEDRIEQARELVAQTGCTILLKGTPTVVLAPGVPSAIVIPRGTPVLATGGSGDMLSGMIGTLLAQGASAADAAAIAAWVHGRAAEIATETAGSVRGVTLHEVMCAMPDAWRELSVQPSVPHKWPVQLASLPRVWSDSES